MVAIPRQASLALEIVIVGGSIAGLACAYALAKAGHRVRVLERSDAIDNGSGGILVPPNMNRLLIRWGLASQLAEHAIKCPRLTFRIGDTGEAIGFLEFHAQVMKVLEADFLLMQYRDVYEMLHSVAIASGVEVCFKAQVTNVDPSAASVTLLNGDTIKADLIIGADGFQSVVRETVLGKQLNGVPTGLTCFSTSVSTALMKDDDELSSLFDVPEMNNWMGPGTAIRGHLVHANERFAVHLFCPDPLKPTTERYHDISRIEGIEVQYYESRIKKISALASEWISTKYVIHEPFERWVHASNKIVLVGEAAHPLVPASAHSSAMCVEDAVTLGQLFSYLEYHDQIPSLLSAYEQLRQSRCAAIQKSERAKLDFAILPTGPAQHARDAALRQAAGNASKDWADVEENFVRLEWEEFQDLFGYDAHDAVDDWWVRWGVLRERAAERHSVGGYVPKVQVSVDTISA